MPTQINKNLNEMYNLNANNLGIKTNGKLTEKWSKQLRAINEAFDGKIEDHKLMTTAILLENTERFLNARRLYEGATQPADTGFFKKFAINLLSATVPNLIAEDIVSVQPMLSRVGEVRYLRVLYGSNKAPVTAGSTMFQNYTAGDFSQTTYTSDEVDGETFTGDGSNKVFDLAWTPVIPGTLSGDIEGDALADDGNGNVTIAGAAAGTIDYVSGRITFTTAPGAAAVITANYTYDNISAPVNAPEIQLKLVTSPIQAKSRKLKALYAFDADYDLANDYGMSMNNELIAYSAAQLKNEIDQEIVNDMYAKATAPSVTWNMFAPNGVSTIDHYNSFRIALTEAGNNIYFTTKLASANFYIVGENAANVVESLPSFESAGNLNPHGPYLAGYLGGKPVYKTPSYGPNAFLAGYKGESLFDAGYIYAPYMPVMSTQLLMDETFTGRQGFATSYGKKCTNGNFYAKGVITNVQGAVNVHSV